MLNLKTGKTVVVNFSKKERVSSFLDTLIMEFVGYINAKVDSKTSGFREYVHPEDISVYSIDVDDEIYLTIWCGVKDISTRRFQVIYNCIRNTVHIHEYGLAESEFVYLEGKEV